MVTFVRNPIEKPLYEFLAASWKADRSRSRGQSFQADEIVRYNVDSTLNFPSGLPGSIRTTRVTEVEVATISGDVYKWDMSPAEGQALADVLKRVNDLKVAEASRLEREAELRAQATKPIGLLDGVVAQANAMAAPRNTPGRRPIVSLQAMPAPHGFTDDRKIAAPIRAYALKCDCAGTNFCAHILRDINLGNDTNEWWSEITTKRRRPSDGRIEIGVPICESVLHRIELAYAEQEAWDGSKLKLLKVNPRVWYDEDQCRFYDVSTPGEHKILLDQIKLLEESIFDTPDGQDLVQDCTKFAEGKGPISCGMDKFQPGNFPIVGAHNFGTNKRLLDWIRSPGTSAKILALAFCLRTYGMCYICYSNREPMFSLVNM